MLLYFLSERSTMGVFDVVYMMAAYAVILFLTLPVHELAHALVAYWCGDNTAKWHGRLSLNPLRHLDLFGTLMILTVGMGYAKPVPINPRNFRHPKLDTILVSLAGPFSNFLMAWLAMVLLRLCAILIVSEAVYSVITMILAIIISVNISLMVFNLLPIPPLDGSRLWSTLLPGRWSYVLEQYSQYITIGLFLLLATNVLDIPLTFMENIIWYVLSFITDVMFLPLDLILMLIP